MQYLQALKTTNLTEKDNYYPFYAGYNSLFHIQNGVEHIAFKTNKVINQGNTFVTNSDEVFDIKNIFESNLKYSLYFLKISKNELKIDGGSSVEFVNIKHLLQILNEKNIVGLSNIDLQSNDLKLRFLNTKNHPNGTIKFKLFYKLTNLELARFLLIPE